MHEKMAMAMNQAHTVQQTEHKEHKVQKTANSGCVHEELRKQLANSGCVHEELGKQLTVVVYMKNLENHSDCVHEELRKPNRKSQEHKLTDMDKLT